MTKTTGRTKRTTPPYADDRSRWHAVLERDPAADGRFVYAVRTTGVYCRPTCAARRALRANVCYYDTWSAAQAAGFRPCRRCRPADANGDQRPAAAVVQACRLIERAETEPTLAELARKVGLSRFHFQRLFKAHTGVTPKAYAAARRAHRVRHELASGDTVTRAIYAAGYQSSGRFYEQSNRLLGMSPSAYRAGGAGATIHFAIRACWLGRVLVAATEIGLCAVMLGDDRAALTRDLRRRFPRATLRGGDDRFRRLVQDVIDEIETPDRRRHLPLDIQGTAFERQVWAVLSAIPAGETASYGQLAARVGRPRAVRAVARACAANPVAVVIPCHRAVRADGALAGYRWGTQRKAALLARERTNGRQ